MLDKPQTPFVFRSQILVDAIIDRWTTAFHAVRLETRAYHETFQHTVIRVELEFPFIGYNAPLKPIRITPELLRDLFKDPEPQPGIVVSYTTLSPALNFSAAGALVKSTEAQMLKTCLWSTLEHAASGNAHCHETGDEIPQCAAIENCYSQPRSNKAGLYLVPHP